MIELPTIPIPLKQIKEYQKTKKSVKLDNSINQELNTDDDIALKLEGFKLGKKNPISLSEIDAADRLEHFKDAIVNDKNNLLIILNNIKSFEKEFIEIRNNTSYAIQ